MLYVTRIKNHITSGLYLSGLMLSLTLLSGCETLSWYKLDFINAHSAHEWKTEVRSTQVAFKLVGGLIMIPVRVNNAEPLNFVFDTGAPLSAIFESHATTGLPWLLGDQVSVGGNGKGQESRGNILEDIDLALGNVRLLKQSVVFLPFGSQFMYESLDEIYFDGIIGYDFFRRFVVEIDYDELVITLSESEEFRHKSGAIHSDWQVLDLQFLSDKPHVMAEVQTPEHHTVQVKLLVDTGATSSFSLNVDGHAKLNSPLNYYSDTSTGLSGEVHNRWAISPYLALGKYKLLNPVGSYRSLGEVHRSSRHGLLGNRVLSRFNQIFDYANKRMLIKPNKGFHLPISADRSGLRLRPHKLGGRVSQVASGTGAERLGLKQGDIVTRINDTQVTEHTFDSLVPFLSAQQENVPLCWIRAQEGPQCGSLQLASRFK